MVQFIVVYLVADGGLALHLAGFLSHSLHPRMPPFKTTHRIYEPFYLQVTLTPMFYSAAQNAPLTSIAAVSVMAVLPVASQR